MGFLNNSRSTELETLDPQSAIMIIVVGAVKADGDIVEAEAFRIRTMCACSPVYAKNTVEQDDRILRYADSVTAKLGEEAITAAANVLTPDLRETAFAYACDMVWADQATTKRETLYLTELANRLGISEDAVNAILRTTVIRNRCV